MRSEKIVTIYEQIEGIPSSPGIYKFLDHEGNLLYIGKAINLKSRVSSYFSSDHTDRPNIIPMVDLIWKIDTIVTDNEVEALVLETALIKKYKPKYNTRSKDDKSDSWIYISSRDELPTVKIIRTIDRKDYKRGRLFGPYPNNRATRQIFKYIRQLHPFCTCNDPKEPCLYFHLGLCNNPKFGDTTVQEYKDGIDQIIKFLQGNKKREISRMEKEMNQLSEQQRYEEAAMMRDKIADLKHLGGRKNWFKDEQDFNKYREKNLDKLLSKISTDINIDNDLERIECYDISNLQGEDAFGAMTVFDNYKVDKSQYRVFKIRGKKTPDDYEMLAEVLERRMKHLKVDGKDSLNRRPDLVLIDGGKGQLSAVSKYIPLDVVLMGISKGRSLKKKNKSSKDQFWVFTDSGIKEVKIREPKILIDLRDEAHRFSLKHHRNLRMKNRKVSVLDSVAGIGPKRKKELKKSFGTIKEMKKSSLEELDLVIKNKKVSTRLYKILQKK